MSTTVTTGPARLSYLAAWEATSIKGSEKKFRCTPLIPKKDKVTIAACMAAVKEAIEIGREKFKWGAKLPKDFKTPLRDGDQEQETEEEEGKGKEYKGMIFFNCSSKDQPGIVDTKRQVIHDETEVYSGVWALVNVNFYPFSTNGSNGVAVSFNHLMKIKNDEKFSARVKLEDAFKDIDLSEYEANDESTNLLGF